MDHWQGDLQQQAQRSTQPPRWCAEHYYIFSAGSCSVSYGGFTWKRFAHLRHLARDERAKWKHVILRCAWTNMVRIEKKSPPLAMWGSIRGAQSLWPTDNTVHLEGLFDFHNGLIGCLTPNTQRLWISDEHQGKLMNKWGAQLCIKKIKTSWNVASAIAEQHMELCVVEEL